MVCLAATVVALVAAAVWSPAIRAGDGPSDGSGAFFEIRYTGNAARLGAVKTDIVVTSNEVAIVCGQASQGISSCTFPAGEACCKRELFNIEAGAFVRFEAVAKRGSVDFGGWGGACAQAPVPCPFDPQLTSVPFYKRVCQGGVDKRGELIRSNFGLGQLGRTDSNAVFGCELTLPTAATTVIELIWNQSNELTLPGECGFQLTNLQCSVATTPTTTTTLGSNPLPPPPPPCGDPDGSGDRTAGDALIALQAAVALGPATLACAACRCDVNGDGELTASDALLLLRMAVGLDPPAANACTVCNEE